MVTEEQIAADMMTYLEENPGVCADVSVAASNFPWIRYRGGEWQYARFGEIRKVEGKVLEADAVKRLFAGNPVTLVPVTEAYQWNPSSETVWEHAETQDVFTDADRCFWCGHSERTRELELYKTTEDGDCLLCSDCHESWENADQIIAPISTPS